MSRGARFMITPAYEVRGGLPFEKPGIRLGIVYDPSAKHPVLSPSKAYCLLEHGHTDTEYGQTLERVKDFVGTLTNPERVITRTETPCKGATTVRLPEEYVPRLIEVLRRA
ncbi:MAG: hypothetical protein GF368_03015 [Candidatus Aenigmarchaeota archaeon]|nr:hypothetical protein [Candidatus Aenigmarchaeota archaeon]